MDAQQRVQHPVEIASTAAPAARVLGAGSSVVLLRPRKLRGTIGVVQRPVGAGWEIEIRTPQGTPLHLTLPAKALHLR